jgi:hypothetical protein
MYEADFQHRPDFDHIPVRPAGSTGRCNTTWYKSFFLKGGVHEPRETMEAIFGPEGRYVEPLEGWTVFK